MDEYSSLLAKWRDDVKLGAKLGEGLVSVVYAGMCVRKEEKFAVYYYPLY